ncbi:YncE family protein [Bacillus infantis]|uniref:YncE family protein n=1 Tax=Bacillus infantis TaxID=324767 RepID=UPI00209CA020|nr:WD40 repeat domain-containing protein [Bacillus infantis]MCP1159179.1 WD40 repeat domain-containing protein [Bacillus infantis]
MRAIALTLVYAWLLLVLAACSSEQYPPIAKDKRVAATVNIKDMSLTFIDLDILGELATWDLQKPYTGGLILSDGDSLLLYGKQLETIDLYSLEKGTKIGEWSAGTGIVNGRLLESRKEIAFADQEKDEVRFYDLNGKETGAVQTEADPLTILEEKEKGRLFVSSFKQEVMTVIDLNQGRKISSFKIHPSAAGALIREEEGELWIGGHGEGAEAEKDIHIYSLDTGRLAKTIPAPTMPVGFTELDGSIFALSHGSSTLYKMDGGGKEAGSIQVGANPFEMLPFGQSLIIAGYDSNDVHLIDPGPLQVKKTIKTGEGPFQIILRGDVEK